MFIDCILNMVIYIFTVGVMFKLKQIELTMSPKYDSAKKVLNEIAKFKCLTYTFIFICVIFMICVAFLFLYHMLNQLDSIFKDVWNYAICVFTSVCFIFFIQASVYLMELGYSFVKLIIDEGYPLSFCRTISLFSLLIFLDLMAKMNFTIIYTFNYFNKQHNFIKCDELSEGVILGIKIFSQILGYS